MRAARRFVVSSFLDPLQTSDFLRGARPSRIRAVSGMASPSAMRSSTSRALTWRLPFMMSQIVPCACSVAVPMRVWLAPRCLLSSRNNSPMSRRSRT